MHALAFVDGLITMPKVHIFEISHLDFELETSWVPIKRSNTDACEFQATIRLQKEIKAVWIDRMRSYYLRVRSIEVLFQEILKVLKISNLTCNLEALAISCAALIEHLHCLIRVFNRLTEQ